MSFVIPEPQIIKDAHLGKRQGLLCWLCAIAGVPAPLALFWILSRFLHLHETGANYLGGAIVLCFVITQLEVPRPLKWAAWGALVGMMVLIPIAVVFAIVKFKAH